jgi:succinate dehydrogenase/fumarate reductase flavoprotein subunit
MTTQDSFNRRDLFKVATAGIGAAAAGSLLESSAKASEAMPQHWDDEADVVIAGYGFAGAAAAITAHDHGAKVLIVEKAPEQFRGGNSRVSGNGVFWPNNIDKAKIYFRAFSGAYMDNISDEMLDVWARELYANRAWLEGLGWKPVRYGGAEYPDLPGADCVDKFVHGTGPIGQGRLWSGVIEPAVNARKVQIHYETPAVRLVSRNDGIVGVAAIRNGKRIHIKANRGVILTTGGFENNPTMIRSFLNDLPYAATMGTPYNTGDGIHMAIDVGADLWHMSNISGPQFTFAPPGSPIAIIIRMPKPNYIWVAKDGTRFLAEGDPMAMTSHGKIRLNGRWVQTPCPLPVHAVFDETFRKGGGIGGKASGWTMGWDYMHGANDWSNDNSAEIAKGWIKKADSIRALAAAIGIPPDNLEATVQQYNRFARAKKDDEFGRAPASLAAIETPPFYAMELTPAFINTQGGPRRNKDAQIVDIEGKPIPRLFSSGELGAIYGFQYQGGGNVAECFAFGRIAGINAAKEPSWS